MVSVSLNTTTKIRLTGEILHRFRHGLQKPSRYPCTIGSLRALGCKNVGMTFLRMPTWKRRNGVFGLFSGKIELPEAVLEFVRQPHEHHIK